MEGLIIPDFPVDVDFRSLNGGYPTAPAIVVTDYENGFGEVRVLYRSNNTPGFFQNVPLPSNA